jgi:hypothetical protein
MQNSAVAGRGIAVDPSIISVLLKMNSSKHDQISKARIPKPSVELAPRSQTWQQWSRPINLSEIPDKSLRQVSEASDTTKDLFDTGSECTSLNGSGGGSLYDFRHQEPPKLAPRRSRTKKFSQPLHPGLQQHRYADPTTVTTNASPEDFAAAWSQAEAAGAWKREEKQHRTNNTHQATRGRRKAKKNFAKDDSGAEDDGNCVSVAEDTQNIPMPKWFRPMVENKLSSQTTPVTNLPVVDLEGCATEATSPSRIALIGRSDEPLKIIVSGYDYVPTSMFQCRA